MPEYDELYRLSDQDFVNIGCTKEELAQAAQHNDSYGPRRIKEAVGS